MRHKKRRTRFGRQPGHRAATLRSLARAVLLNESIKTTRTKAREARRLVEKLIRVAKNDSLHSRRQVLSMLGDRALVTKLFKEIAPLFAQRQSGYTRIVPFNFRKGDGANVVFLELTQKKPEEKPKPAGVKIGERAEKRILPAKKETKAEFKPAHPKAAPEIKPALKEEKAVEDVKKAKVKDETKKLQKQKGFLKKVGGFFRRRTNM